MMIDFVVNRFTTNIPHVFLPLLLLQLSGCAYQYVNSEGDKTTIGFMKVTHSQKIEEDKIGAEITNISNLGISILSTPVAKGVSIGYNNETITIIRNNAIVGDLPEQFNLKKEGE